MKRLTLIVVYCLMPALTRAAPVYLDCSTVAKDGVQFVFSLKIDEDTEKITHTAKGDKGTTFSTEGLFSPNEIAFQETEFLPLVKFRTQFVINRTDLTISRFWSMVYTDPRPKLRGEDWDLESHGSCDIVDVKDRKI